MFRIWYVVLSCFKLQYLRSIAVAACEWHAQYLCHQFWCKVLWLKAISMWHWRRGISMWHPYCIIWCHSQYCVWRSSCEKNLIFQTVQNQYWEWHHIIQYGCHIEIPLLQCHMEMAFNQSTLHQNWWHKYWACHSQAATAIDLKYCSLKQDSTTYQILNILEFEGRLVRKT